MTGLKYLAAAVAVAAAGQIYEHFSHGVYSNYMVFAFMIPLAAGALPNLIAAAANKKRAPSGFYYSATGTNRAVSGANCDASWIQFAASGSERTAPETGSAASGLQLAAVSTLTAGSLVKGALEIYGTTNRLTAVYPVAGIVLLTAALLMYFKQRAGRD